MDLDELVRRLFDGTWTDLHRHGALDPYGSPGVYLLACPQDSTTDLSGKRVDIADIMYVGKSVKVRRRLGNFKLSIREGKPGHCAGRRFYGEELIRKEPVYFSALILPDYEPGPANDLRMDARTYYLEHFAMAHILEATGSVPWLNRGAGGSLVKDENEAD